MTCPVLGFAFWTLACHFCVIAHFSFVTLARIGPVALVAGVLVGIMATRRVALLGLEPSSSELAPGPAHWTWFVVALAIVAVRAAGLGYQGFWFLCIVFLAVAVWTREAGTYSAEPRQTAGWQLSVIFLLAIFSVALTFTAHRPDTDDANFVGFAADAIAHPERPVLSHDVLYGTERLPLILPTYLVNSYELFAALLVRWFGGVPIWWMHAILPILTAALLPFAWAELMGALAPRRWLWATFAALVLLAVLGESHYSLGNFAFVRLFQGKAVLASIAIPLLFAWALRFGESGNRGDWVRLAACAVACVGLSAAALFVVPLTLGIAAVAEWGKGRTLRSAMVFLPALYPLAWGLALRGSFKTVAQVFASVQRNAPGTVAQVFGKHGQYLILLGLLCAPLLLRQSFRKKLGIVSLLYFLGPLNPFLFRLIARVATPESVWRIVWCVPVVGVAAATMVSAIEAVCKRWNRAGLVSVAVVILGCTAYLAPYSSLRRSNGVEFSLAPLKVQPTDWATAQAAIADTPPGTSVLAPEAVAAWIPTFVHRPALVSVRAIYDEQMAVRMNPDEARTRRELRELVTGGEFSPERENELLGRLQDFSAGLIVTTRVVADRLQPELVQNGYQREREIEGYVFFVRR